LIEVAFLQSQALIPFKSNVSQPETPELLIVKGRRQMVDPGGPSGMLSVLMAWTATAPAATLFKLKVMVKT